METNTQEIVPVELSDQEKDKKLATFRPNPAFASAMMILPKSFRDVMEMAQMVAKSGMGPREFYQKPEAVAGAIMLGLEVGLTPMQALQNIMVVNGRPTIWGDAALALALGSKLIKKFDEFSPDEALSKGFGWCRVETTDSRVVERTFSLEDAKRAHLIEQKDTWKNYPGRMLMFRARSWAIRDSVPHVLKGLQIREEVMDIEVIEPSVRMPEPVNRPNTTQETFSRADDLPQRKNDGPVPVKIEAVQSQEPPAEISVSDEDPNAKISPTRRKQLFSDRVKAKVPLPEVKKWLADKKLKDTGDMTNRQAEEFTVWLVKNSR